MKASSRPVPEPPSSRPRGGPQPNELTGGRLPADVGRRLARFLDRVERLRIEDLPIFAAVPLDSMAHARAIDHARTVASERSRNDLLTEIRRQSNEWVARLFSRQQYYPEWIGPSMGRSVGNVDDRVKLGRSLADAITGLMLWDVLDEPDLDELIGPWATLIDEDG